MLTRLLMVEYLSQVLMKTSVKYNKCLVQNTNTVDEDYRQQQKHDLCLEQLKKKFVNSPSVSWKPRMPTGQRRLLQSELSKF